jgi:hypothetical protein
MGRRIPVTVLAGLLLCGVARVDGLTFACDEHNDLYQSIVNGGSRPPRFDSPGEAVSHADPESAVLVLADQYPATHVRMDEPTLRAVALKRLRLYVEFPESFPGIKIDEGRPAEWERVVVASDALREPLTKHRILTAHGCVFLPVTRENQQPPLLVLARVAGYDRAVYGLPPQAFPLLFQTKDGHLIAATKLSGFVTGRFAPAAEWAALWGQILAILQPGGQPARVEPKPSVGPAYAKDEPLPANAQAEALAHYAAWVRRAGLLVPSVRREHFHDLLRRGVETTDPPEPAEPSGDGSLGLLEGYASHIRPDGGQPRRLPLRADCHGEVAMVLALQAALSDDPTSQTVATNLLDFVYVNSGMHAGVFGDPKHPAFGLIAWGDVAPAWTVATYGDDNARALLGTVCAAACLKSERWDKPVLQALLANLRTTGRLGFRGDRIDVPALERNGWKHYHDADTLNPALNFEAYPWATFLWAYRHTGEREFLEKARTAIAKTM